MGLFSYRRPSHKHPSCQPAKVGLQDTRTHADGLTCIITFKLCQCAYLLTHNNKVLKRMVHYHGFKITQNTIRFQRLVAIILPGPWLDVAWLAFPTNFKLSSPQILSARQDLPLPFSLSLSLSVHFGLLPLSFTLYGNPSHILFLLPSSCYGGQAESSHCCHVQGAHICSYRFRVDLSHTYTTVPLTLNCAHNGL